MAPQPAREAGEAALLAAQRAAAGARGVSRAAQRRQAAAPRARERRRRARRRERGAALDRASRAARNPGALLAVLAARRRQNAARGAAAGGPDGACAMRLRAPGAILGRECIDTGCCARRWCSAANAAACWRTACQAASPTRPCASSASAVRPRPACTTAHGPRLTAPPHAGASDVDVDEKANAQSTTSGPDAYRCGSAARGHPGAVRAKTRVSGFPHTARAQLLPRRQVPPVQAGGGPPLHQHARAPARAHVRCPAAPRSRLGSLHLEAHARATAASLAQGCVLLPHPEDLLVRLAQPRAADWRARGAARRGALSQPAAPSQLRAGQAAHIVGREVCWRCVPARAGARWAARSRHSALQALARR